MEKPRRNPPWAEEELILVLDLYLRDGLLDDKDQAVIGLSRDLNELTVYSELLLLRRGRRWGFEFKCTDAPRTTKSMHFVRKDLGLEHLWVIYPGDQAYPLADAMTAMPFKNVGEIELEPAALARRRG